MGVVGTGTGTGTKRELDLRAEKGEVGDGDGGGGLEERDFDLDFVGGMTTDKEEDDEVAGEERQGHLYHPQHSGIPVGGVHQRKRGGKWRLSF